MIKSRTVPFIQEFHTLHQLIRREIQSERERQRPPGTIIGLSQGTKTSPPGGNDTGDET